HFTPLSPNVMATFLGSFGALGVIGHYALHLAWWRSLLLATSSAAIIAGIFYYVIKSLYSITEASSEARVTELIGETAKVSVEIAPGGTGEIVYSAMGSRYQAPARAEDPQRTYTRGESVIIKRIESGIYFVAEA
nr:NfeD family protein [bacterium]